MCEDCERFKDENLFVCGCGKRYCGYCMYDSCGEYDSKVKRFRSCRVCIESQTYISPTLYEQNSGLFSKESTSIIGKGWAELFTSEKITTLMNTLSNIVRGKRELDNRNVYPPPNQVFNAFKFCHLEDVRVVILGQDPYHGEGQAMGLSFSVPNGIKPPPSLVNIFKELENNGFSVKDKSCGDLTSWAKQGVFLYNTSLTVEDGCPASHVGLWKHFSELVISHLISKTKDLVFVLWGKSAQTMKSLITKAKRGHSIISSAHPSPLSAHLGFFGSRPFSRANELSGKTYRKTVIDWNL